MSKARAKIRKKAALEKRKAAALNPKEIHNKGIDHTPANLSIAKPHAGKLDAKTQHRGGHKGSGGKNIPNLAASSRGAARSG
ncbi:MAG: hypothetical protein ACKVIX_01175 [Sphingomonadales bacterium]